MKFPSSVMTALRKIIQTGLIASLLHIESITKICRRVVNIGHDVFRRTTWQI